MVHLLPHWNWPGREGQEIDVRAYSNAEEVELLAQRPEPRPPDAGAVFGGEVEGQIRARRPRRPRLPRRQRRRRDPRRDHRRARRRSPDAATAPSCAPMAKTSPSSPSLSSMPRAASSPPPAFRSPSPSAARAASSASATAIPRPTSRDVFVGSPTTRARAIDGWRWKKIADPYAATIAGGRPGFDDSAWQTTDVRRPSGPARSQRSNNGLFRATFTVTDADLAAHAIELWFGKIDGDGRVFINGKRIGPAGDARAASVYDVKALLQRGRQHRRRRPGQLRRRRRRQPGRRAAPARPAARSRLEPQHLQRPGPDHRPDHEAARRARAHRARLGPGPRHLRAARHGRHPAPQRGQWRLNASWLAIAHGFTSAPRPSSRRRCR